MLMMLIKIRKENPVFAQGSFEPVSDALGCVAYARCGEGQKIMTVANRNSHAIVYVLPEEGYTALIGGTVSGRELYIEGETASVLIK